MKRITLNTNIEESYKNLLDLKRKIMTINVL